MIKMLHLADLITELNGTYTHLGWKLERVLIFFV